MALTTRPSDEEDCASEKVWSKGEKCQVIWSWDGNTYTGRIRGFRRISSQSQALVHFIGYASDNDEWMEVSVLKPLLSSSSKKQKTSADTSRDSVSGYQGMFSPLAGHEEKKRLDHKFKEWDYAVDSDDEPSLTAPLPRKDTRKKLLNHSPTSLSSKKTLKDRKTPITVSGGQAKTAADTRLRVQSSEEEDEGTTPHRLGVKSPRTAPKSTSTINISCGAQGFDEEDFVKPQFRHQASSASVPHVLSPDHLCPAVQIPATINRYLHDYQRNGVQFLYEHFAKGEGAILADDMGLGKTVQVIAFIAAIKYKTGTKADVMQQRPHFIRKMSENNSEMEVKAKPCLVICPASVLHNWIQEFDTWGHFKISKYHVADKVATVADLEKGKVEVVVTTYETARDNIMILNRFHWEAVFADEVHKLKSTDSSLTQMLKGLRCKVRFGLTGTPMQNSLDEFWCILDWAKPGCFGSITTFTNKYIASIKRGQRQDASKRQLAEARKAQEQLALASRAFMLRRTKSVISHQLPTKVEQVVYCQPASLQLDIYQAILQHDLMKQVLSQKRPCSCGSGHPQSKCCYKTVCQGQSMASMTFTFMHLLLKAANHIALLLPEHTQSHTQKTLGHDICRVVFEKHPQFVHQAKKASFRTLSDPKYCGKMKVLQGMLSVLRKQKSRVLLFSYSTRLLDIIETYVMTQGLEYRRLDGTTSSAKRAKLVQEFNQNSSIFLFLISTRAGGVGLNLTGADVVIIFDPNWNPTHDLQAQDRAYRIGQHRNVRVYRLISSGMIEENIYLRQIYKQQLGKVAVASENAVRYFNGVEGDKRNQGELFGLENMFELRTGRHCLTQDIIKRQDKLESGLEGFPVGPYLVTTQEVAKGTRIEVSSDSANEPADDQDHGAEFVCSQVLNQPSSDEELLPKDGRRRYKSSRPQNKSGVNKASPTRAATSPVHGRARQKRVASNVEESDTVLTMTAKRRLKSLFSDDSSQDEGGMLRQAAGDRIDMNESFDSISDVMDHCGVVHQHENRRVVGGSTAENHMTRCAIEDVYLLGQNSQLPAAVCDPIPPSSESDTEVTPKKPKRVNSSKKVAAKKSVPLSSLVIGKTKVLIGQTPRATRRSQFATMASFMKMPSAVSLAQHIVSASPHDLTDMLGRFYTHKNKDFSQLFQQKNQPEAEGTGTRTQNRKVAAARGSKTRQKTTRLRRPVAKGCCYSDETDTDEHPDQAVTPNKRPLSDSKGDNLTSAVLTPVKTCPEKTPTQSDKIQLQPTRLDDSSFDKILQEILGEEKLESDDVHGSTGIVRSPPKRKPSGTDQHISAEEATFNTLDSIFLSPSSHRKSVRRKHFSAQ